MVEQSTFCFDVSLGGIALSRSVPLYLQFKVQSYICKLLLICLMLSKIQYFYDLQRRVKSAVVKFARMKSLAFVFAAFFYYYISAEPCISTRVWAALPVYQQIVVPNTRIHFFMIMRQDQLSRYRLLD